MANHTSMIDFIILEQMTAFAVIMQKHPGWVGKFIVLCVALNTQEALSLSSKQFFLLSVFACGIPSLGELVFKNIMVLTQLHSSSDIYTTNSYQNESLFSSQSVNIVQNIQQ